MTDETFNKNNHYDVAVVGSGPAGAAAARGVAAAGLRVVVLEKARVPRYKTCGGGVLRRALELLGEADLPVAERACFGAEFGITEGQRYRVLRGEPLVYMAMRDSFDAWLMDKARAHGAELRDDCAVTDVIRKDGAILLKTDHGDVTARFVIAADGANGIVPKKTGWGGSAANGTNGERDARRMAPALECEVTVPADEFARLSEIPRFDFYAIKRGYGWVFPKRAHLSIGVATVDARPIHLQKCFDAYVQALGITRLLTVQRHGFVIPLCPRSRVLARDGVLLVGDAAGLADPVTAEGISYAILSGQLAAGAIVRSFPDEKRVSAAYHAALKEKLLPELKWGRRLAKILYGMPRVRDGIFRRHGQRLAEAMAEIVCGRATYTGYMSKPGSYLKLVGKR